MRKLFYCLFVFVYCLITVASHAQTQADIDTITARLNAETMGTNVTDANVAEYLSKSWDGSVGRWTDINYGIVAPQPGFKTNLFFARIKALAVAYSKPGTYYYSAAVMTVITKALNYFFVNQTMFNNNGGGWYRDMGYPMDMSATVLLVKNAIDPAVEQKISDYIEHIVVADFWGGGANMAWISTWRIHEGCILNSARWIKSAVSDVASIMNTTKDKIDGLKADFAYFQHGMNYSGGYGADLIPDVLKFSALVKGTAFDVGFPIKVLSDYILNGEYWFQFHKYGDLIPQGRGGSHIYVSEWILNKMMAIDSSRAQQYRAYIKHQQNNAPFIQPGNKYFFSSDIMVHRSPTTYMSVKIPSVRNKLFEVGNYQDMKGYNLGYGFTQILTNGNEYDNIEPVWDWSRLPGTTTPLGNIFPNANASNRGGFFSPKGTNEFAGGVSDSSNGVVAFTSTYNGVTVTKGYFFLGSAMVCLGASITSTFAGHTVTSVNQTNSIGDIILNDKGKSQTFTESQTTYSNTLNWVHHDNVGYYFPPQTANIVINNSNQSGKWYDINHTNKTVETKKVFSIWFDHGDMPFEKTPSSYQYIVVPNISASTFSYWISNNNPYTVLSNTQDVQCVKNSILSLYGIVFYKAGSFTLDNGLVVSANKPAIVIVEGGISVGNIIKVSVADPLYEASKIAITIKKNGVKTLETKMPKGNYLGATVSTSFLADEIVK